VQTEPAPGPGDGISESVSRCGRRPRCSPDNAGAIRSGDHGDRYGADTNPGITHLALHHDMARRTPQCAQEHEGPLTGDAMARSVDQSASSSSAMSKGSEVMGPCPSSGAGDMIVIVPLVAMLTQGLSVLPARSVAREPAVAGRSTPSATAKVRPATPSMSWRR